MTLITIIKPAVEPVTDADLAVPARLDTTDFSEHINQFLVPTFRAEAEHRLGRRLITQTVELVLNDFPTADQPVDLQLPNVQSLVSVKYLDGAGVQQTVAPESYRLDADSIPSSVSPVSEWPSTGHYANAVRIRYVTGYAATGAGAEYTVLPKAVRQGMLMHISLTYPRNVFTPAEREAMETARDSLLNTIKDWSFS